MNQQDQLPLYDRMVVAAVADDWDAVWDTVDQLVSTRREAFELVYVLATMTATPIAHVAIDTGGVAGLDPHGGCKAGRAAGQIVTCLANLDTRTAGDLTMIVVDRGEQHCGEVVQHLLSMLVAGIKADLPEDAWRPVIHQ